jgi:hypothetical protein
MKSILDKVPQAEKDRVKKIFQDLSSESSGNGRAL